MPLVQKGLSNPRVVLYIEFGSAMAAAHGRCDRCQNPEDQETRDSTPQSHHGRPEAIERLYNLLAAQGQVRSVSILAAMIAVTDPFFQTRRSPSASAASDQICLAKATPGARCGLTRVCFAPDTANNLPTPTGQRFSQSPTQASPSSGSSTGSTPQNPPAFPAPFRAEDVRIGVRYLQFMLTVNQDLYVEFLRTKMFGTSRDHMRWISSCLERDPDSAAHLAIRGLAAAFYASKCRRLSASSSTDISAGQNGSPQELVNHALGVYNVALRNLNVQLSDPEPNSTYYIVAAAFAMYLQERILVTASDAWSNHIRGICKVFESSDLAKWQEYPEHGYVRQWRLMNRTH